MSKYLKVLFVALFTMFLVSSSASAATLAGCNALLNAAGNCAALANITTANASIATELVGQSSYTPDATGSLFIAYNASNAFAINDLLTFTTNNAPVTNTAIVLCGNSTTAATSYGKVGTLISSTDSGNGVSTMTFRFDNATSYASATPSANLLWVSANSTAASCGAGSNQGAIAGGHALTVKLPVMSAGATATVAVSSTTGGGTSITGATVSATTYYSVVNQLSQVIATDTAAIDFVTGRVKLIPNNTTTAVLLDQTTANAWTTTNAAPTIAYAATTSDKLDITLSGSMTGISRICWDDANCTASSTTKFTISTTANTATYSAAYATAYTDYDKKITFVVDGTTLLSPRTFTVGTVNNLNNTSYLDRALVPATTTFYTLTLASYQAIIPYISADSTYKTICFINNGYNLVAPTVVDILSTESGATLLTNQSVGSIGVGRTTRVDFASNITPYTWTSGAETAGTAIPLTGLNASDRYSALITVNAAAANVSMNCIQLDPAGSKRAVPVLSSNNGWAQ